MSLNAFPWVVLGCGYTGARLARRLIGEGAAVTGTRRREEGVAELVREGIPAREFDIDQLDPMHLRDDVSGGALAWLTTGARVVYCAPPSPRTPHVEAALVDALNERAARRLIYVSSTGVYPATGGAWVDEGTPADPAGEGGRRRWAAESRLAGAAAATGLSFVALRAAAIYGPGRGVHARLRAGTYRVVGDGSWVSRVHVDDLVTAIIAAALAPVLPRGVYNVADDCPISSAEHADAVAAMLGLPSPPRVPADAVSNDVRAMLMANRRISNRNIKKELGMSFVYPTWREGTEASLAEEDKRAK